MSEDERWEAVTNALQAELVSFLTDLQEGAVDLTGYAAEISADLTLALRTGRTDLPEKLWTQMKALAETKGIRLAKNGVISLEKITGLLFNVLAGAVSAFHIPL